MLRIARLRPGVFPPRPVAIRPGLRPFSLRVRKPKPSEGFQQIRLQRVKVRRKWFRPWPFFWAVAIYYACYQIYSTSVFGILNKFLDEQENEIRKMPPKERKKLEEELDKVEPIMIPLPFTTTLVDPKPYKATDPEWIRFVKLSKNPELINKVKQYLAEHTRKSVAAQLSTGSGSKFNINRVWLDIKYPTVPPPTYERSGLCWDDDGLSVVTEPVDSRTVFKLHRILVPSALSLSMWSFSIALAKQNFLTAAKYLGYNASEEQTEEVRRTLDRLRQNMARPPPKSTTSSIDTSGSLLPKNTSDLKDERPATSRTTKTQPAGGSAAEPTASSPLPSTEGGSRPSPPSSTASSFPSPFPLTKPKAEASDFEKNPASAKEIYGVKEMSEHTKGPIQVFKKRFEKLRQTKQAYPPRGSVGFSGLVEVSNADVNVIIDLQAWYDPKTNTIDANTLALKVRSARWKRATPVRR
ncbi:hypothetical protein BX600DRAFT_33204 [Xylariales sp. PMI_506]|nr:hypothetical protein BX600DRAFT_33204 [Xylariales sp. PMI_506]